MCLGNKYVWLLLPNRFPEIFNPFLHDDYFDYQDPKFKVKMSENHRIEPGFTCCRFLWVKCIQIHIEIATDHIQEEIRRIVVFLDSIT